MSTSKDLRRIALSLEGTTEAPHFDRTAFRAKRIYVTLAADEKTANFMFSPEEQEFKCMMAPEAFAPVPNAWASGAPRPPSCQSSPSSNSRMPFAQLGAAPCLRKRDKLGFDTQAPGDDRAVLAGCLACPPRGRVDPVAQEVHRVAK